MSNFFGISYTPNPAMAPLQQQFTSSLSQPQQTDRTATRQAWKGFEQSLTPEQHAAQQKWHLEKLEGAPASEWKADKQAYLNSLSPQEMAARQNAVSLRKVFHSTLSPEQQDMRLSLDNLRDASILQSLGTTPGGTTPGPQLNGYA